MDENKKISNCAQIQPYWKSGDFEDGEVLSLEMITARACGILLDNEGFWGGNRDGSIIIAVMVSLASVNPDKDLLVKLDPLFIGHYYRN